MYLARDVELRTTTASVALRPILTAVDAAPLPGAGVEEEDDQYNSCFALACLPFVFLSFLFPGYMGLIDTLKTIVYVTKQRKNISLFLFLLVVHINKNNNSKLGRLAKVISPRRN